MAVKVWGYGVLVIFAFIAGVSAEAGNENTTASIAGVITLGVWSVGSLLVAIGYSEGKQNR